MTRKNLLSKHAIDKTSSKPKNLKLKRNQAFQNIDQRNLAYSKIFQTKVRKANNYQPIDFRVIREKANQPDNVISSCVTSASTIRIRCSTEHHYDDCGPEEAECRCEAELDSDWGLTEVSGLTKGYYATVDFSRKLPVGVSFLRSKWKREYYLRKQETFYEKQFKTIRDTLNKDCCYGIKMIEHNIETAEKLTGQSPQVLTGQERIDNTFPKCFEFVSTKFIKNKIGDKNDYVTCFYFHGGGFMWNSPQFEFKAYLSNLAKQLNIRIFAPDYRKTPKFSYPTPINDCYEWMLHYLENAEKYGINPENFIVAGDSAGGTAAMACLVRLFKTNQIYKPFYVCAISPVVCGAYYDLPSFHDPVCIQSFSVDKYLMYALSFSVGERFYDSHQYIPGPKTKPPKDLTEDELAEKSTFARKRVNWARKSHCLIGLGIDEACFDREKYLPIKCNVTSQFDELMHRDERTTISDLKMLYDKDLPLLQEESKAVTNPEIAFFCISTEELKEFLKFYHGTKFHFNVAEFDSTRDEILMVANRMIEAKGKVTWSIARDMPHDYPFMSTTLGGFKPSANKDTVSLLADMKDFIEKYKKGGKKHCY